MDDGSIIVISGCVSLFVAALITLVLSQPLR
jgi:hypothetical protein